LPLATLLLARIAAVPESTPTRFDGRQVAPLTAALSFSREASIMPSRCHLSLACVAILFVAALPFSVLAQTAATPPVPVANGAVAPKPACNKPGEFPGRLASDSQIRAWTRGANGYLDCLKKYLNEQQAAAKPYQDAARVYVDAANVAIDEYNASARDFKAQQERGGTD
jgi:hypothetical protein